MKFKHGTRRPPIEYEKDLVKYWKEHKTFEKSVELRPKDNAYVFYDGPPFITGVPHTGTLLSSIAKDVVPRYWTMKGKRVERVWGWDCHGLPAEVYTEKKLGIKDRNEIGTSISLEDYIKACRANMVQTGSEWEDTIERIGRWVDFKGAYKTMDKDYMESVWWAFKKLYEAGKIYEGEKVLLYCTRDATPLSKAEVAMDNSYQDDTDPSVYVKFKLKGEDVYLLAWTTTPWTLPSNTALAVNKEVTYQEIELDGEHLILAKDLVEKVLIDEKHQPLNYKVLRTLKGEQLIGKEYEPLFKDRGKNAHKIWHAGFVHTEEGTGIAHESPAYGEDDYTLAKQNKVPLVLDTDEEGHYTEGEWKGQLVWDANKEIAKTLQERGVVWKIEYITHSYPHCHRCGTRLMYRAHPSWFMNIDEQKTEMLEQNANINWFPRHIKHGRFEKTIESAPDWNLSRDRFWATAMPVWKATGKDGKELIKVIGSYDELKELAGVELEDYHRPWIDDVTFTIDGAKYKRVEKVMDSWFEAGSMPFAQFHYPFENTNKFEENFPGDFIVEYVGQVRAWFYYLHAVGVGLQKKNVFSNVITTGTMAGNDGRKMSKSYGNYTDPNLLMDEYSADALRFLLMSSTLMNGEDYSLVDKDVADVHRKLAMVWNMYDFFTMYAEVDGWEWNGKLEDPITEGSNLLDQWIVSRVHQLIEEIDANMQKYDIPNAIKPILPFIDDASNWYVRRSRRRFWKSGDDADKQQAYQTLHYVLVRLSQALAPFTPFLAEELFLKLTGSELGESVHLLDWPEIGHLNELLLEEMAKTRKVVEHGLSLRMFSSDTQSAVKIRQPLLDVTYTGKQLSSDLEVIIKEEVNVKEVINVHPEDEVMKVSINKSITPELKREGLMREVVRQVQRARKEAGLQVDDRIKLSLKTNDAELEKAIEEHADSIKQETLAAQLGKAIEGQHKTEVSIEGQILQISLSKAS